MSDVLGLAGWPMSEVQSLAIWGGLAGLVAGIALHLLTRGERRDTIVMWCLLLGGTALVLLGVVTAIGGTPRLMRKVWALAVVGYPAFVAGGVLLALNHLKRRSGWR
ncbi:MAG TPA: hypothetical protein VFK48_12790 [Usitatibacter sp.]|nr:hypothetical protein [Usitatibacter sp.]